MKIAKETFEKLKVLGHAILTADGKEIVDPRPMMLDVGLKKPLTLQEQIRRVIKQEVSMQAQMQGHETFEEAEDFEVDDDFHTPEPISRYLLAEDEFPVMTDEKPDEKKLDKDLEKFEDRKEIEENAGLQDRKRDDSDSSGSESGRPTSDSDQDRHSRNT